MSEHGSHMGTSAGPKTVQLNPERAPALIAKYQKMLGKDLERIEVIYSADGVTVDLYGLGKYAKTNKDGDEVSFSIAAFKAEKAEAEKPSAEEALTAFKNKFELRLNLEFPANAGMTSASDAEVQAFLAGRPLAQRRAMLMSNKQFKTAYPNGFVA